MSATFRKTTYLNVPVDKDGNLYVRDLHNTLGLMSNGGKLMSVSYNHNTDNLARVEILTDQGDLRA